MEFDGTFCKLSKLPFDRFFHFFAKQKIGRENDPSKEK